MPESKLFRLNAEDANRINDLIKRINTHLQKNGMKTVKATTLLRALIFYAKTIEDEELIEAVKQAQIFA